MYLLYNYKEKKYTDGSSKITYYSYSILKGKQYSSKKYNCYSKNNFNFSYNRTKQTIYDYCKNNDFTYFVTLTFKENISNKELQSQFKNWVDTFRRTNPNFKYLFVREYHKKGKIHIHGLVGGCTFNLSLFKVNKKGISIYNILDYDLGYSTCTFIQNKNACCKYICKYITKELCREKNVKRYWASRNLIKPIVDYKYKLFFDTTDFTSSKNGLTFYKEIDTIYE